MNIEKFLELGLKNCIHCGSYLPRPSLLCTVCERNLFNLSGSKEMHEFHIQKYKCYSLFRWEKDRNKILNKLILNLKGPQQRQSWKYFADMIAEKLREFQELKNNIIITYCPNYQDTWDHAGWFSYYLSKKMGVERLQTLKIKTNNESKTMNKSERIALKEEKFEKIESVFEKITDIENTQVLFVDDVITTGATLLAASEKHKDFKEFIGLSLAFRR